LGRSKADVSNRLWQRPPKVTLKKPFGDISGGTTRAPEQSSLNSPSIRKETLDKITALAEAAYPFECCGFVIGDSEREEVRPVTNIQDRKHAEDPKAFPRDARTAYLMEPREHLAVLEEADRRALTIKAIYHSHPDHDAYFSQTDKMRACSFDPNEPDYPETAYLVISVKEGKFSRAAAFVWVPERRDFAETELLLK
jgi:[CysO sulfur-carrier protein]-S-L-cysteine hydrolase